MLNKIFYDYEVFVTVELITIKKFIDLCSPRMLEKCFWVNGTIITLFMTTDYIISPGFLNN